MSPLHPRATAAALLAIASAVGATAGHADGGRTAWPGSAPLAGAWAGTARSTAVAGLSFPVRATVAVAATGRPTGRVSLGAPVNCAGGWQPVSTTGRVTTFSEAITARVAGGDCITDGTVRLSPASGGRLRYVWTKGAAGSVAYLDPVGISGTWSGTLAQAGMPPIPARIRVVGVRTGQMQGISRYGAPLSCRGRLEPRGSGSQRRAVLREVITQSTSAVCMGVGVMTLSLRTDGRLGYRWSGGGVVSTGILRRVGT